LPYRAKTMCNHPGCQELASGGHYCNAHSHQDTMSVPDHARDKRVHRLYDRKWKERRAKFLASNPWCEDCMSIGIYTPSAHAHHEQKHHGNRTVFNSSPLKALCHSCHSRVTIKETKNILIPIPPKNVLSEGTSSVTVVARVKMSPIKALNHGKSE
jgi:5-methylcytosine-specific restriction protein A